MTPDPLQRDDAPPLVLLIDDSKEVHRLLRARLRNEAVRLIGANGGIEGLKMAREHGPAIVLLDLNMPDVDGFEVLRALKDDPATVNTPVIVLSGLATTQDKVAAFDLGAVDYVTKPFDLTELRARLRSSLKIHELLTMLAQRAQIDGMTGLWNRTFFNSRWAEEVSRSARHDRPLSLAMFDLDDFKSVNDTFGHPAGDAVLQGFASLLAHQCRQSDVVCRFGGEEFTLIMPDTAPDDAKILLDRIRASLEGTRWPRHPERVVTVSIGVVGTSDGAGSVEPSLLLERADANLYRAKEQGRNRVVASDLSAPAPRLAAG